MLNLFRAQWYRLVRNRAFWGLLAVFGVLVFLFVIQVDEQSVREGVYRNFPALGGAPEGVGMTMDVEAVLGQFWVPQLLLAFVGMLSAAFFGDDFRYAGARSLDVMPGFRWRYVGSAVLIIVVIALIFLVAASFVAWLALLPNPVMSVGLSGGRFFALGPFAGGDKSCLRYGRTGRGGSDESGWAGNYCVLPFGGCSPRRTPSACFGLALSVSRADRRSGFGVALRATRAIECRGLYACGNRCVDAAAVACRRCGGVWFGHAT